MSTTEHEIDPALVAALAGFAASPDRVVALDFDGVLAPLVPRPEDSTPLPEAVAALQRLARSNTHLGFVSGRSATDAALRRATPPSAAIFGSHGAEQAVVADDGTVVATPPGLDAAQDALLDRLRAGAVELTTAVPGSWVENKATAVVVHTRPVTDDARADALEADALAQLGSLDGVRAIAGKRVVELSVAHTTKGDAVRLLRTGHPGRDLAADTPVLFVGDDVTDEDALAALGPHDIGIKVGDGETHARFRVADPVEVAQVLTLLADAVEQEERSEGGADLAE